MADTLWMRSDSQTERFTRSTVPWSGVKRVNPAKRYVTLSSRDGFLDVFARGAHPYR